MTRIALALVIVAVAVAVGCGSTQKMARSDGNAAPAVTPPQPIDVSAVKDGLTLFTDGKQHYYALFTGKAPDLPDADLLRLFYGDGRTFDSVKVYQSRMQLVGFEVGFDDPRVASSPAGTIRQAKGETTLECYGQTVALTPVAAPEAKPLLAAATFNRPRPEWSPFALSRDNDENYTYVDVGYTAAHKDKKRIFRGKKGALRELAVVNEQYDSDFSHFTFGTREGNLKATANETPQGLVFDLRWEGGCEQFSLAREDNWRLVFGELGVYREGRSPTPCDPMIK
jgi:hypothetical protein